MKRVSTTTTTSTQTQTNPTKPNKGNRRSQRRRSARRSRVRSIPAAYTSSLQGDYAKLVTKNGALYLECSEIFSINTEEVGLVRMIPINPAKWYGTRSAAIARNYTSFRPTYLHISWLPSIGTNVAGHIALGSAYDGSRVAGDALDSDVMTRFCISSNGGAMSTCWQPIHTTMPLGRNLGKNAYPIYQVSELDDIPLWVLVAKSNAAIRGYVRVTAKFTLRNQTVNITSVPVAGSATATFTTAESGPTKMSVPKSAFAGIYEQGQQFLFTTAKQLLNKAGQAMVNVLGGIIAHYTGIDGDNYQFEVANDIAGQEAPVYMIGREENF